MSKNLSISKGYYFVDISQEKKINSNQYEVMQAAEKQVPNSFDLFDAPLPDEINVFSELPEYVYKICDAERFLTALRKALLSFEICGVKLSKLCVSDHTDSGVVLDWIFNYYRVYFSFDTRDGNFYGIISTNPEEETYSNEFKAMRPEKYDLIAREVVDYVLTKMFA